MSREITVTSCEECPFNVDREGYNECLHPDATGGDEYLVDSDGDCPLMDDVATISIKFE